MNSIDREAIKHLQDHAVEHSTAKIIGVPGGGDESIVYLPGDTEPRIIEHKPRPRSYTATTIGAFCAMVTRLGSNRDTMVLVSLSGAVAILDEGDGRRRERVRLRANINEAAGEIGRWQGEHWHSQAELIRSLRTTLRDTYSPADLLPTLRQIKFSKRTDGASEVQHGRESMGASIERQVSGAGDLPEDVVFSTPWFDPIGDATPPEAAVTCALDIDTESAGFMLKPVIADIRRAELDAVAWLATEIAERVVDIDVFSGATE